MLVNKEFLISKEDFTKCAKFAKDVIATNSIYAQRGQTDVARIMLQIITGKMGELAARNYLMGLGKKCSDVDFSITKNGKSFDADLVTENKNVHVKSQDIQSANIFGLSWTFQWGGDGKGNVDTKIFNTYSQTDAVIFCLVNVETLTVEVKAANHVSWLHKNNLFKEPTKENLKGKKKVVFYSDIEKLSKGV